MITTLKADQTEQGGAGASDIPGNPDSTTGAEPGLESGSETSAGSETGSQMGTGAETETENGAEAGAGLETSTEPQTSQSGEE